MPEPDDARWMRRALELARQGWGRVHPNPMVGAVVLDAEGRWIAEGYHAEYGGPHAELVALDSAAERAAGGTLYVTLEPCAHHGKTPPCVDAIEQAGVARVVVAAGDPSVEARGGADRLAAAGIDVQEGLSEREARDLNAIFYHAHERSGAFVALKYAISLDGRLSARRGAPTRLTGPAALREAHRLRAGHDAVMVGSGTALSDDPLLTVRHGVEARVPPTRVVLDSELRTPTGSRLVDTIREAPLWLVCAEDASGERAARLQGAGAVVLRVPRAADGGLELDAVFAAMLERGARSVLVEGGGRLGSALLRAGMVERHYVFLAPVLVGPQGTPAYEEAARAGPAAGWRLVRSMTLGPDVMVELAAVTAEED